MVRSEVVSITGPAHSLSAYVARPEGDGPWPGVVVIHDVFGMTDDLRHQADRLAVDGYLAVAPDLFSYGRKLPCLVATLRAMRSRRGPVFGDVDAAHAFEAWIERRSGAAANIAAAHRPTPDRFEGTYDLSPIDASNVSMTFLGDTIALVRAEHVRAFAILTPTNHTLLHEYIDTPEYDRNLASVHRALAAGGVSVLDYDRRFGAPEFIDNDHLTAPGNRRLAALLAQDVRP